MTLLLTFKTRTLKYLIALIAFTISIHSQAQAVKVEVRQTPQGWEMLRDGKPYYVKGAGGDTHLDIVVNIGGNSIRTWGVEEAQTILDNAQKHGLTVMLGMWLQHERHGFDYSNKAKVEKQLNHFKSVIDQFKNHPALLMWGIGNEVDLFYSNTRVWDAIQDIAKYAHQVDPNHPTSTVTAGLDSMEVALIKQKAPDIDVYCVNTYGDIGNVPYNIRKWGWTGPYMITEWGPNGHWESPNTPWGAAIEQSSLEKAEVYNKRYTNYIAANPHDCIGSYVFLWGQKQEYTLTWYGLFTKEGKPTQAIDALQIAWSSQDPTTSTPSIANLFVNGKNAYSGLHIGANSINQAFADAYLIQYNQTQNDTNNLHCSWKILAESNDKKAGGDLENEASEIPGLIKKGKSKRILFKAPNEEGAYRLFVTIEYQNKIAYANYPFYVDASANSSKPKSVRLKKFTMDSFNP